MSRMTKRKLESTVAVLNRIVGAPDRPFYRDDDGTFRTNRETFFIEYAYGVTRLVRDGGSVNVQTIAGTMRETYEFVHAFIDGIEYAQRLSRLEKESES